MGGRATRLVLYVGWPCALALVVALAGLQIGDGGIAAGRRLSTSVHGKFEALSVCIQSITGERRDAEAAGSLVTASLHGLGLPGPRQFTLPATVDVGCPGEPAHLSTDARTRRVASRVGSSRPEPSPYHLHIFLMPRATLQMLRLEPDLGERNVVIEEYVVEGIDSNATVTGVTFGLYATIEELADGAELRAFFEHAVQMQSLLGAPPRHRS